MTGPKLGILAGGGDAPKRLIAYLRQSRRPHFLICITGQADADLGGGSDHVWLPLGAGEAARNAARAAGVKDVVMIGRVRRPSLFELKPDMFTLRKLMQIGFGLLGDDGLLKAIAKVIEAEGFRVVGIHDVLADFVTPAGQLGAKAPGEQDWHDIKRGVAVARKLGEADAGQSVVVQQGMVLGLEAIEGTDAMIARAATLKREGGGGVLVKLCKPQQDRRLDLPAIGLETVARIAAAGFAGIAVEAGASLIIDHHAVIAAADQAGIFLYGYSDE
ncbi:MAG: UDP-2,3-diacylglucosamine diphosphatase LpxI [Alphaproteobacteria bacterium]